MSVLHVVLGLRTYGATGRQVWVRNGVGIAQAGSNGETEEVADSADISATGMDLLENAVLSQRLGPQRRLPPWERTADRQEAWGGAPVDEQVRVTRARPGPPSVVEPGAESREHGAGQGDGSAPEDESSVDDIGDIERAELLAGQGVEGDQGDGQCDGGIGRIERFAYCFSVLGEGHGVIARREVHAACRVGEDLLARLEHAEQRAETLSRRKSVWSHEQAARRARLRG